MTVRIRSIAWSVAIALLAGCAPSSQGSESPIPADGPGRESAELHARCEAVPDTEAMACYDAGLLTKLQAEGIPAAMALLDRLTAADEQVRRDGHMYAHSLGLAAYSGPAEVGKVFRECLPTYQSGCYHGVIQAYFADMAGSGGADALSSATINDLCSDYRASADGDWLLFQCVHGMGHGLAQITGHDLKATLAGCDRLDNGWEREGCYGGAFMENIMEAVAPHHMVGRPGESSAMAGHSMAGHSMEMGEIASMPGMDHGGHAGHGGAMAPAPKLIDPADPLYPCSALAEKYLHACYQMQTSVILHLNHGNIPAAARSCDTAPSEHRAECYQSLGRDVSAYTLQDFDRAASFCTSGDPLYQPWCHIGFVKNVIDLSADSGRGLAYCRALADVESKKACYRAVGEEVATLHADRAERAAACDAAEWAYRDICGIGAGVRE